MFASQVTNQGHSKMATADVLKQFLKMMQMLMLQGKGDQTVNPDEVVSDAADLSPDEPAPEPQMAQGGQDVANNDNYPDENTDFEAFKKAEMQGGLKNKRPPPKGKSVTMIAEMGKLPAPKKKAFGKA